MNQTFSGMTLMAIVIVATVVLFIIATFIKPKMGKGVSSKSSLKMQSKKTAQPKFKSKPGILNNRNDSKLRKLQTRIESHFSDFQTKLRDHRVILERNGKKVALLTLDAKAVLGRRRLGDVTVINFHKLPSVDELKIELQGL